MGEKGLIKSGTMDSEECEEGDEHLGKIRRRSRIGIMTGRRCVYTMRQCFCEISTLWQSISPTKPQ